MFQNSLARASRRRVLLAGVAAAAASAGLTATAQDAQAAFTLGPCQGASGVWGQGASFQNGAQAYFRGVFNSSNGCNGTPAAPSYKSNGSGNGLTSAGAGGGNANLRCIELSRCTLPVPVGFRDPTVSLQATDEPPSTTELANINAGTASPSDDALAHIIPVATGANVVMVRAPSGCDLSTITNKTNGAVGTVGGNQDTGDSAADLTQRPQISNVLLEKAFAGDSDANTWGELTPGISGTPSDPQEAGITECASVPVKRIVRQDKSGTTFGFKAYLALVNPSRGWLTTYVASPDNTAWPRAGGTGTRTPLATGGANADAFCPNSDVDKLCSGSASGNPFVADAVNATDGSIGYSDIATVRGKGFEITPDSTDPKVQDYTFWLPAQNNPGGSPTGFAEGTINPIAHRVGVPASQRGSNCQAVNVANVPTPAGSPNGDPTLGDWSRTFAAGGPVYGLCVITYIVAWDDNAVVYGNTPDEEAKARTVKDFLATIVGGFGQQFVGVDYSPLPNPQTQPLQTYAQNAVNAIGWNKTAGTGGGAAPPPVNNTPPPVVNNTPPPPTNVVPVTVKPSNAFTVSSGKINSRRTALAYMVKLPGRGRLVAVATYKSGRKTIRMSTVTTNATSAGTAKLTVKLTSKARSALRRSRRLAVSVKFTYAPTGGDARSITKTVTVRPKAASRQR